MTIELARQGNYGKAMKRISSSWLAPFTEQTHRKLTDLHLPVNDTELVASLPDAHVAYLLLRHCASAQRIAFLMRNVDPASTELFFEESFNTQAIHDICQYNVNIEKYDHIKFPGVVPRTFIGSILVSLFHCPVARIFNISNGLLSQILARATLGLLVFLGLYQYIFVVREVFGNTVASAFSIITATQFHFSFYMTRTLPNTFAMIFVTLIFANWLSCLYYQLTDTVMSKEFKYFVGIGVSVSIIFRFEIALLFGCLYLVLLTEKLSQVQFALIDYYRFIVKWIYRTFVIAAFSGILSIGISMLVDSILWRRFIWPEGEVAWSYGLYCTQLHCSTCLSPLQLSESISSMTIQSGFLLYVSSKNYPGGEAMLDLKNFNKDYPTKVYIDNAAAQTGVTRFLERATLNYSNFSFDKTENLSDIELVKQQFDLLLLDFDKFETNLKLWNTVYKIAKTKAVIVVLEDSVYQQRLPQSECGKQVVLDMKSAMSLPGMDDVPYKLKFYKA
ncbi:hypothetical protein GJ496_004549 [Pomphorhynchus laevis]|nr:hypothetical protein GJ496_004549 [Pomphorhynchus laevis]